MFKQYENADNANDGSFEKPLSSLNVGLHKCLSFHSLNSMTLYKVHEVDGYMG